MKILYPLLCYYPSQAGGPANTLYWQNIELAQHGVGTVIVSRDFGLEEVADLQKLNDDVSSENHDVNFVAGGLREYLSLALEGGRNTQIVHFSSIFFPVTLPLLAWGLLTKKEIVISPRGELYASALSLKPKRKVVWLKLLRLMQRKIHFHATNKYEKGLINKHFPKAKSVETVPNFIKLPKQMEIPVENKFVFLGRINPIKNIDVLINAFSRVVQNNQFDDLKLVIIGGARLPYEQEYFEQLKRQVKKLRINDRIVFRGHLDGVEKEKELASAKALVLPSRSENFGNVVLEALAQATPVIASAGTPWQILDEKKAGAWVEPNEDALSKALENILNLDETEYSEIRGRALSLCKGSFDIKSNISLWIDYYKKIMNHV